MLSKVKFKRVTLTRPKGAFCNQTKQCYNDGHFGIRCKLALSAIRTYHEKECNLIWRKILLERKVKHKKKKKKEKKKRKDITIFYFSVLRFAYKLWFTVIVFGMQTTSFNISMDFLRVLVSKYAVIFCVYRSDMRNIKFLPYCQCN